MLNGRDVLEEGVGFTGFTGCQGRGRSSTDEDAILMRKLMIAMATQRNRKFPPLPRARDTHTPPLPVRVIQPNSRLKYRFQHSKITDLLLGKKKKVYP